MDSFFYCIFPWTCKPSNVVHFWVFKLKQFIIMNHYTFCELRRVLVFIWLYGYKKAFSFTGHFSLLVLINIFFQDPPTFNQPQLSQFPLLGSIWKARLMGISLFLTACMTSLRGVTVRYIWALALNNTGLCVALKANGALLLFKQHKVFGKEIQAILTCIYNSFAGNHEMLQYCNSASKITKWP